jgi:hypothetical protein
MGHDEKVARMVEDLASRGMGKFTVVPPLFRLAWVLGLKIKPPLFLDFGTLILCLGISFGLIWGVLMGLMEYFPSFENSFFSSLGAGALFGIIMAFYYRRKAKELDLPAWEHYLEDVNRIP